MARSFLRLVCAALLTCVLGAPAAATTPDTVISGEEMPGRLGMRMDIVFVFDSTGSMDDPLVGVKADILGIMRTVVKSDPVPDVRYGIVTYRDYESSYMEKHLPLTRDHALARTFLNKVASGGGHGEIAHVSLAMHVAVSRMNWDSDKNTARVIFLFGDTPPHKVDDGFDYKRELVVAKEKGITVNTIACGRYPFMVTVWKEIAEATGGEFRFMAFAALLTGLDGATRIIVTDCDDIWVAEALPPADFFYKHFYMVTAKFRTAKFSDLPPDMPGDDRGRFAYIIARSVTAPD